MAMPDGSDNDRRPIKLSPRTPDGPSDTFSAGMPTRSTDGRYHSPSPAVSDAFSSSVRAERSSSMRASTAGSTGTGLAAGRFTGVTFADGGSPRIDEWTSAVVARVVI
jgi:hypothetical protein